MASRILSWKIDSYKYAYLYIPNKANHISDRITDEAIIDLMIAKIGAWSKDEYKAAFNEMNAEIKSIYNNTIEYSDDFYGSGSIDSNVVILTGKDGEGSSGSRGSYTGNYDSSAYDEFLKMLDNKLAATRNEIETMNQSVIDNIESNVTETLKDAQQRIDDAREELDKIRKELSDGLTSAEEALDKASKLFEMGDVTTEDILDAIGASKEAQKWITSNSGAVTTIEADYNEAKKTIGAIYQGKDVSKGFLSMFAESINAISGTMGTVQSEMDASTGTISQWTTWYDNYGSAATYAARFVTASGGVIDDKITHFDSAITSSVEKTMDAVAASITDSIMAETDKSINTVTQKLGALSARVETVATSITKGDGDITEVGNKLDALSGSLCTWVTKTNTMSGIVSDMRDSWTQESGMLRSVADLIWDPVNSAYTTAFTSYIQQTASSATISVMGESSAMTAAIKVAIEDDEAIIKMIADEVVIDSNVIAKALSAETADIGGIAIGEGQIYSNKQDSNGNPLFHIDGADGGLSAINAYIKGDIVATSLTLTGSAKDDLSKQISEEVDDKINDNVADAVNQYITEHGGEISAGDKITTAESATTISGVSCSVVGVYINDSLAYTVYKPGNEPYVYSNVGYGTSGGTYAKISKDGLLTAHNALIYGTIYADAGKIGNVSIANGGLSGNGYTLTTEGLKGSGFTLTKSGLTATNAKISGAINGASISGGSITIGRDDENATCIVGFSANTSGKRYLTLSKVLPYPITISFKLYEIDGLNDYTITLLSGATSGDTFLNQSKEIVTIDDDYLQDENVVECDSLFIYNPDNYPYGYSIELDKESIEYYLNGCSLDIPYILYESNAYGYFSVSEDGHMYASAAEIRGNLALRGGNSISMTDSGGNQTFLASSNNITLDTASTVYGISSLSYAAEAEGYWEETKARGYSKTMEDGTTGTNICNFYKSSNDTFELYPTLTIKCNGNCNQGYSAISYTVKMYMGSSIIGTESGSATKTINLENYYSAYTSTAGNVRITVSVSCTATAIAPDNSGDITYASSELKLFATSSFSLKSSTSNASSNLFKIGPNGIQMMLSNGSNLSFGMINNSPMFSVEIYSGSTKSTAKLKGGLKITTDGITYSTGGTYNSFS